MDVKQNQTFFHGMYSSLSPYLFFIKNIKVIQQLSKSKFPSFMTKVKPNDRNETKPDFFSQGIFKYDIIFH